MSQGRSEDSKAFKKIAFDFGKFKVRYAWVSQRGYYPEDLDKANQDAHVEVEAFGKEEGIDDCAFFGVYDGHGKTGDKCAIFTRDSMPCRFAEELLKNAKANKEHDGANWVRPMASEATIQKAYKSAFVVVNKALHDKKDIDDSMSGTTAITCLLYRGVIYVANVGDSRAIIGEERNGKLIAYPLSNDQTPFRKDERERVKAAGAVVANMDQMDGLEPMHENWTESGAGDEDDDDDSGDPPRVWLKAKMVPGCAFTRSIGDAIGETVGVFAEPEVVVKDLDENDKHIIIASDGVWEFLTNQTVLNMVAAYKSPLKACKAVVNEAYKLWLQYDVRTDDITMIAIYLEETGGLAAAHAAETLKLKEMTENVENNPVLKKASMRELRRKSSAIQGSGMAPIDGMPTGVVKKDSNAEARPVRRVMTKEKRKAVMSTSQDDTTNREIAGQSETGMKYTVKTDKILGEDDVKEIKKAVKTNFLLAHLNEKQQQEVFGAMQECVCKAGDTIIVAGQPGEWFYVVHSGVYDAFIDGQKIVEYKVDPTEGDDEKPAVSFGELALLYHNQPRAASIMCSADGKIWRLGAKTFRETVMRSSTQQLLKTLRSVEVLRELTLSQLQRLYDALSEVKVPEGQQIITEGEPGRDFYVVMEGTAVVLKYSKANTCSEEVMTLREFDYFGERALLNDAPRAATVKAKSEMKLLQISKKHFEEVLGSLDEIIDAHRRKREELARRKYLQVQAEGLLDASAHEFAPVKKVAVWTCADLFLVKRKEGDARYVVRVVSKKKATDEKLRGRVMSEIKLVGDMTPSPFIPSLLATFSDRSRMYAVMGCQIPLELSKCLSNESLIASVEGLKQVKFITAALCLAMIHLHRQEIVCRMCALDTILLDDKGYPQLLDFTLSKKLTDCGGRTFTLCGLAEYNSPEQVKKIGHGPASDFWAIGILMYELLFNKTPFAPPPAVEKEAEKPSEKKPTIAGGMAAGHGDGADRLSNRRASFQGARGLEHLGLGKEHDNTDQGMNVKTYKLILDYAKMKEPELPYPSTFDAKSNKNKEIMDLLDDFLEPQEEARLGNRSSAAQDDIQQHEFFKKSTDFSFHLIEDGSLPSPLYKDCADEMREATGKGKDSFDAPPYVGDNRWCDDWDYTCTVGATVEEQHDKPTGLQSRRNSKAGLEGPPGVRRGSTLATSSLQTIDEKTSKGGMGGGMAG